MKNRIIIITLTAVFILGMAGCSQSKKDFITDKGKIINTVESELGYTVFVDTETDVMYVTVSNGGTCVLVNPDGTPKIYGADNGR